MEHKKTPIKAAAERVLHSLHQVTLPFAEQKVHDYYQQANMRESPLHLLGVSVEHIDPSQAPDQQSSSSVETELADDLDV